MYSAVIGGLLPTIRCKQCRNSAGPKNAETVLYSADLARSVILRGQTLTEVKLRSGVMTYCRPYRGRQRNCLMKSDALPTLAPKVFRFSDIDQFRSAVRNLAVEFTPLVRRISAAQTILHLPGCDINFTTTRAARAGILAVGAFNTLFTISGHH
jgi:hypothetical protein